MTTYEMTYIMYPEQERFQKGKELVSSELKSCGAKIVKEDDLGERELAYLVKNETKGHYYYMEAEMESEKIVDLEKTLKLSSEILKYLFIRKD